MGRSSASSAGFTLSTGIITTVEILDGTIIAEDMANDAADSDKVYTDNVTIGDVGGKVVGVLPDGLTNLHITMPANTVAVATSGGDYDSVQDAINSITDEASNNIYTVLIYPGVYTENVVCTDWINLVGINRESCTITNSSGSTVTMDSNMGIYNLTITNTGSSTNAVQQLAKTDTIIKNCSLVVTHNTTTKALYASSVSSGNLKVYDTHFKSGSSTSYGYYSESSSEAWFWNCDFEGSYITLYEFGGHDRFWSCRIYCSNSTITDAGLFLRGTSCEVKCFDCTFLNAVSSKCVIGVQAANDGWIYLEGCFLYGIIETGVNVDGTYTIVSGPAVEPTSLKLTGITLGDSTDSVPAIFTDGITATNAYVDVLEVTNRIGDTGDEVPAIYADGVTSRMYGIVPTSTRYYSIPAASFIGINAANNEDILIDAGTVKNADAAQASRTFTAPLTLDQGVTITSVNFFYWTNDAAMAMSLVLHRYANDGTDVVMATMNATNDSGNGNVEDTSITSAVIDNSAYQYGVLLSVNPNDNLNDCYFRNCIITYTITEL